METTVQAQEIEHGAAKVASGDSHLDDGWVTLVPNGAVPSHIRQTRARARAPPCVVHVVLEAPLLAKHRLSQVRDWTMAELWHIPG